MRWSPPRGGISIVLAITAACGHTEPVAHGDAIALAPVAARSTGADGSDAPGRAALAPPVAPMTDAAPASTTPAARSDVGEQDASAFDVKIHCLEDAGAPRRTLIRLANHARRPRRGEPQCAIHQLTLEVPSLGVARDLCTQACGQFLFDSQKNEPSRATFVCENDMELKAGTVWVDDGVVFFEKHDAHLPVELGGGSPEPAPPVRPNAIPIACGTRPELQTAGRLDSRGN